MPKEAKERPEGRNKEIEAIPVVDIDTEEGMTLEESLAKVAMLLAKVHDPRVLSEVSDNEIRHCAALYVVAQKMGDKMLADFLHSFLLLRISRQRKGRSELLDIARSARDQSEHRLSRIRQMFSGGR